MKHYRVYSFDGGSRIVGANWIEAADDTGALDADKEIMDCIRVEVWDRDRLVGRWERPQDLDQP